MNAALPRMRPTSAAAAAALILAASGLLLAAGCRSASVIRATDMELGRLAGTARKVFDMGDAARAAPLYRAALDRARALDDPAAVAATAGNLAACLLDAGDPDGARRAIREARDSLHRTGGSEADALILESRIALAQGRPDEAGALAASLADLPAPPRTSRAAAALLAADIALRRNDPREARAALGAAARTVTPGDDPALQAWYAEAAARLRLAEDDPAGAADAFENAARLRGQASQPPRVIDNLRAAANARANAHDPAGEADCRYRAARALVGIGRTEDARALLDRAAALAGTDADSELRNLIEALRMELPPAQPAAPADTP